LIHVFWFVPIGYFHRDLSGHDTLLLVTQLVFLEGPFDVILELRRLLLKAFFEGRCIFCVKIELVAVELVSLQMQTPVHKVDDLSTSRAVVEAVSNWRYDSRWETPAKASRRDERSAPLVKLVGADLEVEMLRGVDSHQFTDHLPVIFHPLLVVL